MAYREFSDSDGRHWRAWSTVPSAGSRLRGGFDQGWLTFECTASAEKLPLRRMVPIPDEWETVPEERLAMMCRAAEEVRAPAPGTGRGAGAEGSGLRAEDREQR